MIHAAARRCAHRIGNKGLLENIRFLAVRRMPIWQLASLPTSAPRTTRRFSSKKPGFCVQAWIVTWKVTGNGNPLKLGRKYVRARAFPRLLLLRRLSCCIPILGMDALTQATTRLGSSTLRKLGLDLHPQPSKDSILLSWPATRRHWEVGICRCVLVIAPGSARPSITSHFLSRPAPLLEELKWCVSRRSKGSPGILKIPPVACGRRTS